MRLSTKGRYATRLLLAMARCEDEMRAIRKRDLAEAEGISVDYVAQILVSLKHSGLVCSMRGKHGGFRLAKSPGDISVWEVIEASDETMTLAPCLGGREHCSQEQECVCRSLWEGALRRLKAYFSNVTLADLLARSRGGEAAGADTVEV